MRKKYFQKTRPRQIFSQVRKNFFQDQSLLPVPPTDRTHVPWRPPLFVSAHIVRAGPRSKRLPSRIKIKTSSWIPAGSGDEFSSSPHNTQGTRSLPQGKKE